jgi:flagellar biosynthesis/type III secretory pathway protein FliH
LFNQPHTARSAIPWQPNAGISEKLSSRGYATTRWTSDAAAEPFADLGYPTKSSGFSAAHYQPTRQPLSQQAMASLALLEKDERNASLGQDMPEPQAVVDSHAHLPFVMDAYGASRPAMLHAHVDPQVLKRALAHAELAETLVVSPITSDDVSAELVVIHPDVAEPTTAETLAAEASAQQAADQAVGLPAVAGGMAPEDVAQREAEQFAHGLAQGREEAATALAEAAEAAEHATASAHEAGAAQGLAEGLQQGLAQGREEGLKEGLKEGLEAGMAQGAQQAREAMADEMAAQRVLFDNVSKELGALMADPKKFFEPLKRLALHIAEQVVVGELQTSSKAIERLVARCMDALDHPVQGAVVLELNPEDKALLQAQGDDAIQGMRLEAVHDMQRGSVRVFANDTVVEDLVANRLEGLARSLLVDVDAWRETSPLIKPSAETEAKTEAEAEAEVEVEAKAEAPEEGDDVHS